MRNNGYRKKKVGNNKSNIISLANCHGRGIKSIRKNKLRRRLKTSDSFSRRQQRRRRRSSSSSSKERKKKQQWRATSSFYETSNEKLDSSKREGDRERITRSSRTEPIVKPSRAQRPDCCNIQCIYIYIYSASSSLSLVRWPRSGPRALAMHATSITKSP